jgi:protein TonB
VHSSISYVGLRRVPTKLLLVGGLHLVVFWALLNAFNVHPSTPCLCSNTVADVIDEPPPPAEPIPLPNVTPTEVKFTVDPPPVIPELTDTDGKSDPTITEPHPDLTLVQSQPSGTAEPEPQINGAAVDPHRPLTQPDYPAAARRADEQGKVALQVLVGTDGRVRDVKVVQSSGFARLDQAAVNEALAHWRLRPATRNGQPFEQWITLGVVFRLENR